MSTGPLFDFAAREYVAKARRTDPQESHDAAARVNVGARERQVLEALMQGDATSYEVAARLGVTVERISPRFRPLEAKGKILRVGRKGGRTLWRVR